MASAKCEFMLYQNLNSKIQLLLNILSIRNAREINGLKCMSMCRVKRAKRTLEITRNLEY